MAELVYKKRAIFPKGEQTKFLLGQFEKIGISWFKLANKIGIDERTLNDWKREKYSISIDKLEKICKLSNTTVPVNIKIRDPFWYVFKGAKKGGLACLKKYGRVGGDQAYQKKKWYEWWNKKGQYRRLGCIKGPLPIRIPIFSKNLAEFTGIVIGDGGITEKQVIISTNSVDDRKYGYFVKRLIKKLFDVNAPIYFIDSHTVMIIAVSRKRLVEFCNQKLGLHIGNKLRQGLDIPKWVRKNSGFERACLKGIMDTDGCIFDERHKIKNKFYTYKRLNITSASPQLRKSIFEIFKKNDLSPKIRNNRCVQIENKENIEKYFQVIGTSNPKHLKRYYK